MINNLQAGFAPVQEGPAARSIPNLTILAVDRD
jgi:hypothetical protein